MYSYGSPHMAAQKQDDQLERTFSSYVRIQDVVPKTYLGRWTIGRSGERGSGISVLPARYDDDDDVDSVSWMWECSLWKSHWKERADPASENVKENESWKMRVFINNPCHAVGSKNAGQNWSCRFSCEY